MLGSKLRSFGRIAPASSGMFNEYSDLNRIANEGSEADGSCSSAVLEVDEGFPREKLVVQ